MTREYSINERVKIVEFFIECGESIVGCQRKFRLHFGVTTGPARSTIQALIKKWRLYGSVRDQVSTGRPASSRTTANLRRVKASVRRKPKLSIRRRSSELNIPATSLHRILRKNLGLFPYKIQVVQELKARDHEQRLIFAETMLEKLNQQNFLDTLMMTDEAHFVLNGFVNKQNYRFWGSSNPQMMFQTPLHPERCTVWCGITSTKIFGPYFFETTIDGENYRQMLQQWLFPQIDADGVITLWFQQDGATAHTARATMDILKDKFENRVISRFGAISWPPRSPDLSAPDFWLWGHLKDRVYRNSPQTLADLRRNIEREINSISPRHLRKVMSNFQKRLNMCVENGGQHLKDIIFHK